MPNEHAIALIMGIFFVPGMFLYVALDKAFQNRLDAVATGFVDGVQPSAEYRVLLLYNRLLPIILVAVAVFGVWGVGFLFLARTLTDESVRLLAHIGVFVNAGAAVGWLLVGGAQVFYCRAVLRQAEAD
jgi:uncharacterized membrane protein YciS (DUF1049 family)